MPNLVLIYIVKYVDGDGANKEKCTQHSQYE